MVWVTAVTWHHVTEEGQKNSIGVSLTSVVFLLSVRSLRRSAAALSHCGAAAAAWARGSTMPSTLENVPCSAIADFSVPVLLTALVVVSLHVLSGGSI